MNQFIHAVVLLMHTTFFLMEAHLSLNLLARQHLIKLLPSLSLFAGELPSSFIYININDKKTTLQLYKDPISLTHILASTMQCNPIPHPIPSLPYCPPILAAICINGAGTVATGVRSAIKLVKGNANPTAYLSKLFPHCIRYLVNKSAYRCSSSSFFKSRIPFALSSSFSSSPPPPPVPGVVYLVTSAKR